MGNQNTIQRGLCPECGHPEVALNASGTLRVHTVRRMGRYGAFSDGQRCDGSGKHPEQPESQDGAA